MADVNELLLTKDEYAAAWKVSVRTITNWMAAGLVRFEKRGKVVRIYNDLGPARSGDTTAAHVRRDRPA